MYGRTVGEKSATESAAKSTKCGAYQRYTLKEMAQISWCAAMHGTTEQSLSNVGCLHSLINMIAFYTTLCLKSKHWHLFAMNLTQCRGDKL